MLLHTESPVYHSRRLTRRSRWAWAYRAGRRPEMEVDERGSRRREDDGSGGEVIDLEAYRRAVDA